MIYEETVILTRPFDEVVAAVKEALAAEGFGTLTEIDMQATLGEKTGKEMDRYVIVGACNPQLAGRALDVDPRIGVFLPCNVVIRAVDGDVVVEAFDPHLMSTISGNEALGPVADEVRARLNDALMRLGLDG